MYPVYAWRTPIPINEYYREKDGSQGRWHEANLPFVGMAKDMEDARQYTPYPILGELVQVQ